ncbi:hypothetical protein DL546_007978 [Coniochaeta pulveracea]|uniref:Uncharacterized protein n=1 Tax=Coniochaeta pulveracea TaxID=177199 RepID=A0A420YFH0_9PEZI|nr:hypothetical protein DL546_007978 [Coniochaeta pulveracea]
MERIRLRQDIAFQLNVFPSASGRWSGCEHTRQLYRLQRYLRHKDPPPRIVKRTRSMVSKFTEDLVVADQLLRLANVKPAGNVDSILSWHPQDLETGDIWLVKDQILPASSFSFPVWYLSASLLEHIEDEAEIKEKIRVMAQAYPRLAEEARRRINDGCYLVDGCGTNLQSPFRRK